MPTKRCRVCEQTKPLTEFYTHPNTKDGHAGICKLCQKAYIKGRYTKKRVTTPDGFKLCPDCKRVLPHEAFAKNKARRDGLQVYCSECWPKWMAQWRQTETGREFGRLHTMQVKRNPAWLEKNRPKLRARMLTTLAIRFGYLTRQPCEFFSECGVGADKTEAHHTQYDKPLEGVRWLCARHHKSHGHDGDFRNPPA